MVYRWGPSNIQNHSAFRARHLWQTWVLPLSGHVFLDVLLNFSELFSHPKSMDNNSCLPCRLFVWIKINNVCKMPSNSPSIASIWETIVALGFSCSGYHCNFPLAKTMLVGRSLNMQVESCWIWASRIYLSATISVQILWSWAQPR